MTFPATHTTKMLCRLFPLMSLLLQKLFLGRPSLGPRLPTQLAAIHTDFPPRLILFTTHLFPLSPSSNTHPLLPARLFQKSSKARTSSAPRFSNIWFTSRACRSKNKNNNIVQADSSPRQRRPEVAVLRSLFINQREMRCLSGAPSRHTSA